jgi:hypothetical protein
MRRWFGAHTVEVQRALAVVLVLQLLVSAVLVVLMAMRSPINAHPDELLHFVAGLYFREHWLPPAVAAPDTVRTYSHWGYSYLDHADIVYWAFGKATVLGEGWGLAAPTMMRGLQMLLYWGLVAWAIVRARTFTPALGFLLLTPQVWYVFSYINGDALPFALLTVLVIELGWPDSSVRSFLKGAQARPTPGVFVVGGLLGLLALSKLNYLVSLGFLGWVLLWLRKEVVHWTRAALLVLVAAAIALPWATYHGWVNDFQTGQKVAEYAEKVAVPELKPSGRGPHSFPLIRLRAKGVPLSVVLVDLNWLGRSFQSFCGRYGWMSVAAEPSVYRAFGGLYAALLAILILPVALRGTRRAQLLLLGVLIFAGLVLGQSIYRSWVHTFQEQGRYLFPVLPMLFFYWRQCEAVSLRIPALLVTALLGMHSLLSFALVGLGNLV